MQYNMNLHNGPFESIKSGSKTIEMRLYDERRKTLQVGDTILFTNNSTSEQMLAKIVSLQVFDNFEDLYRHFDKVSIGYKPDEIAKPDDMLLYYTLEQIKEYGVLAIGIKLC